MTSAGDNLIESTTRALLRERIEATPRVAEYVGVRFPVLEQP